MSRFNATLLSLSLAMACAAAGAAPASSATYVVTNVNGSKAGTVKSSGSPSRWDVFDERRVGSLRRNRSKRGRWDFFEDLGDPQDVKTSEYAKRSKSNPNRWNIYQVNDRRPFFYVERRSKETRWRFYGRPPRTRFGWAVRGYVETGAPGPAAAAAALIFGNH